VAAIKQRQADEGQRHADQVEKQRRDVGQSILDDDEG
jgi:hypothetical protein